MELVVIDGSVDLGGADDRIEPGIEIGMGLFDLFVCAVLRSFVLCAGGKTW